MVPDVSVSLPKLPCGEHLELPEKSFIVGYNGRETLLHTDTHFYPYGVEFIEKGTPDNLPQEKIETLKQILKKGYTGYTFKTNLIPADVQYFKLLEVAHGIILKNYSEAFCKMELISDTNKTIKNINSDPICYKDVKKDGKKIWDVTLKWPF